MTATQAAFPAVPSLDKIEMEERKRSLITDGEDLAPSRKRFRDENGNVMRMSDDREKEIEDYQKDSILRQMKEYKRQKKDAEEQLSELRRKAAHHNDHLRIIDAWFAQLLSEVEVLAANALPTPPPGAAGEELYNSALLFEDNEAFSDHLHTRSASIKHAIAELFGRIPPVSPDAEDLRRQLNDLLAKEKEHVVELRQAIDERESMRERLEQAMGRYMTAERKLDRAKSTQVQKLERQAIMGSGADATSPTTSRPGTTPKREVGETNGELENGTGSGPSEAVMKETLAVAERQKAQVAEIEAENDRLTNELSAARTRLASLADDDYAETALFKNLRSSYDANIRRINDLEATNIQLREEAQRLQAERTSYRTLIDDEHRNHTNEIEVSSARAETDLARIRHARDQLTTELAIVKSTEESNKSSLDRARELEDASQQRIAALESQVQRLQLQLGEIEAAESDIDAIGEDELRTRLRSLQQQHSLLSNELPSMELAWKKAQAQASKKVEEIQSWEEQIARLSAEKSKADQKYFAAMKAKDLREIEVRTLKSQNTRSSEIVSQLKETEAKTKELCGNLERQLIDAKDHLSKLEAQHRLDELKLKETTTLSEGLRKNVDDLKSLVSAKDKETQAAAKSRRETEEELERTKTKLDDAKRLYDNLRKSRAAIDNADSDDWRKVAICPVCNANIRNTVIKLCGHVFCSSCVKDLISNRSRKCPSCGKAFGTNDHMPIVLT